MNVDRPNTRDRILQSAFHLFYREGFSRVSVDAIAEKAKVTKRTVYYHFKSKDDIVADVLNDQHSYMMRQFREWASPASGGIGSVIGNLFDRLESWADGEHWLGSGFTRISSELADMPGHPARQAASSHKANVERWLARELAEAGLEEPHQLARQILILIEGSMSLALIHGDTSYFRSAGAAARILLAGSK